MSFLDQIKSRRKDKENVTGGESAVEQSVEPVSATASEEPVCAPRPMTGLFTNPTAGPPGGGISFLDQIKARRKE
jgi:hypothetical protein